MYFQKILLLLLLSIHPVFGESSVDAEAIFKKSIKLFSLKDISFIVDSDITHKHSKEKRSFFLAKQSKNVNEYSLLIRFIVPADIKCTAVLIKNKKDKSSRYAYFPSLNRVRIIPAKDENKEIFGIGMSYDELSNRKGKFTNVTIVKKADKTFYKLVSLYKNTQTDYYINQKNNLLENIKVHKNNKLIKTISIFKTMHFQGNQIIKNWRVEDLEHHKYIDYNIREESVTDRINKNIFFKNRLERCILKAS